MSACGTPYEIHGECSSLNCLCQNCTKNLESDPLENTVGCSPFVSRLDGFFSYLCALCVTFVFFVFTIL